MDLEARRRKRRRDPASEATPRTQRRSHGRTILVVAACWIAPGAGARENETPGTTSVSFPEPAGVVETAALEPVPSKDDPTQATGSTADELQELRDELARVRDELAALKAAQARDAEERAAQAAEHREAIEHERERYEARIDELEGRIELLQAITEEPPPTPPPTLPEFPNALNPRITVFLNGIGRADDRSVFSEDDPSKHVDNRMTLRESELDFRGAIDPFADGVVTVAIAEEVPGEFTVELEEGYAHVKRLPLPFLEHPPAGLTVKAGRFRTEFGRMNRLHTHDLPQVTRPLVVQEFLGQEGSVGDGVSGQCFLPIEFLDEPSTLQATVQGYTGTIESADHDQIHGLANLTWSRPIGDSHRVEVAGIAHYGQSDGMLGRNPVRTYSAEALYTWRPVRRATHMGAVVGGQLFVSDRKNEVPGAGGTTILDETVPRGFYVFGQGQFTRNLFAGVRYDETETIASRSVESYAVMPYVSWYPTEFLRLRVGFEHMGYRGSSDADRNTLWFEVNAVLGSHPPEPYWSHR